MPGLARLLFGVFWIVAGFVITGLSYAFPILGQYAIWYGAWIFGGVMVIWGLVEMAAWNLRGQDYRDRRSATVSVRTIMDAMCFVARADGKASDEEISAIHRILREEFGFDITVDNVRERVAKFDQEGSDFVNEVSNRAAIIGPDFKHEIVRAALLIAFSDGKYSEPEAKACSSLVTSLGPLPQKTSDLIKRVFEPASNGGKTSSIDAAPVSRESRYRAAVARILRLYPRGLDNLYLDHPKLAVGHDVGVNDTTPEEVALMGAGLAIARIVRQIIPDDMRATIVDQLRTVPLANVRSIGEAMVKGGNFDVPDDDDLMFGTIFISWAMLEADALVKEGKADASYFDDFKNDVMNELNTRGGQQARR